MTCIVIANCFPELNIDVPAVPKHVPHRGYWKVIDNQRAFVERVASQLGIFPL